MKREVVDIETLIQQVREAASDPTPAPWPHTQKLLRFLCNAMEAMVGEVRVARAAEAKAVASAVAKGGE